MADNPSQVYIGGSTALLKELRTANSYLLDSTALLMAMLANPTDYLGEIQIIHASELIERNKAYIVRLRMIMDIVT